MSNRTAATLAAFQRAMRPRDPSDVLIDAKIDWVESNAEAVGAVLDNVGYRGWEQQMVELAERMQRIVSGAMEGTVRR